MRSIFLSDAKYRTEKVYNTKIIERLKKTAGLEETFYSKQDLLDNPEGFADVEFVFSSWGMITLTEEQIKTILPSLKAVFYAAGSVQYFARPFLNCGVKVFSAWAANAVPVAEYTVAQIILANKGFFRVTDMSCREEYSKCASVFSGYCGNYDAKIGIIGAGMIGKMVLERLKDYNLKVFVFDPFLPDEKAVELGAEKVSLERIFAECNVVSNHLADNEQTRGMLNLPLFESMQKNAVFLNTGRGAQVIEADLIKVLSEREDIVAVLDVTHPEPPEDTSALYSLKNCILTPHIAGSNGNEVFRMAEYMAEEFDRLSNGQDVRYEVTPKMLETMA